MLPPTMWVVTGGGSASWAPAGTASPMTTAALASRGSIRRSTGVTLSPGQMSAYGGRRRSGAVDGHRRPEREREVGDAEVVDDPPRSSEPVDAGADLVGSTGQRRVVGEGEQEGAFVGVARAEEGVDLQHRPAR